MTLPARDRKSLVIVLVSMGCWAALLTALRVPVAVFVGWVALGIVYLAVPCTAYAVVMRARTATRFSLRTLLLMTTGIAVVLAVFAGSRSWHSRDAAKERENLAPGSAWNGTTEKAKTVKGGR